MKSRSQFPLVKLPDDIQVSLYLIREELKSRKLFSALHQAGIDDCYFQPHLDSLILRSVGIDDASDETTNQYNEILDRRSKKITADNDSIVKQAMKVYWELREVRKGFVSKREHWRKC